MGAAPFGEHAGVVVGVVPTGAAGNAECDVRGVLFGGHKTEDKLMIHSSGAGDDVGPLVGVGQGTFRVPFFGPGWGGHSAYT